MPSFQLSQSISNCNATVNVGLVVYETLFCGVPNLPIGLTVLFKMQNYKISR